MTRIYLTLCLLVVLVPAQAEQKEILVLGDSLSAAYGIEIEQGWVYLLEQRLREKYPQWRVRNASISGSTTDNGFFMLRKALEISTPDIVILELGANDGLRGFPIAVIKRNLRKLIDDAQASGATVLLMAMELPRNYGSKYTDAFSRMYTLLAQEEGLQLLPFLLIDVFDDPVLMQEDRLHPTAQAQPRILDTVWPGIKQALR